MSSSLKSKDDNQRKKGVAVSKGAVNQEKQNYNERFSCLWHAIILFFVEASPTKGKILRSVRSLRGWYWQKGGMARCFSDHCVCSWELPSFWCSISLCSVVKALSPTLRTEHSLQRRYLYFSACAHTYTHTYTHKNTWQKRSDVSASVWYSYSATPSWPRFRLSHKISRYHGQRTHRKRLEASSRKHSRLIQPYWKLHMNTWFPSRRSIHKHIYIHTHTHTHTPACTKLAVQPYRNSSIEQWLTRHLGWRISSHLCIHTKTMPLFSSLFS